MAISFPFRQTPPQVDPAELAFAKSSRLLSARTALAALLEQVEVAKAEVREAQADFDATFRPGAATPTAQDAESEDDEIDNDDGNDAANAGGDSQWRQIVDLLTSHPAAQFTASDVCATLGFDNIASIRTMLATLVKKGHIRRIDNGVYASLDGGRDVT